jgi:SnoaL-like domain
VVTQANVDLVLESIRRFRPEGLDDWAKLWDPDARLTVPEGYPEPGPYVGLEAVRGAFDTFLESFPAVEFEDVEVVATSGPWVVVTYRVPVRGAASGVETDFKPAVAYRVEGKLLIECAVRWQVAEALEAAGLSE